MKLARDLGSTNQILSLYIRDQNSVVGSGLTGLSSATAGLTCYYNRDIDGEPTHIPLRGMTPGLFQASGIVEVSTVKMPGSYHFSAPNECFASGQSCHVLFYGVSNMEPIPIEIDLGPTPVASGAIADRVLYRNISGGSDGGRTVKQGLHFIRNRWSVASGILTVCDIDDSTTSWTATVESNALADPIIGNDPS